MGKSTLYNIYADLVNAMKNVVEEKRIFLKDRPSFKEGSVPMSNFIVIDLPVSVRDYVIGNNKTHLHTTGVVYAFTQARSNNTLDLNAAGTLADSICGLFPISGDYAVATNPVVTLQGSDGHGFQVTMIAFDLRGKWRAFEQNNN